jgi:hypothetical protein
MGSIVISGRLYLLNDKSQNPNAKIMSKSKIPIKKSVYQFGIGHWTLIQ